MRLRAAYGTPEFNAEYIAAVQGKPAPSKPTASSASLQWLFDRYRETGAWLDLSNATRRQRENIMLHVLKASGAEPYKAIRKSHIVAGADRRAATPAQARNFLDAMRGLFRWAKSRDYVQQDPTEDVQNPARRKGAGFVPWTEDDVTAYQKKWPIGTRQRVWLDVLLYTGLRRGDAVVIGRQHVRDGVASIQTEKTGSTVTIPVLPVLQKTLDKGPCGDLAWICGERGQPFTKESFGNVFAEAARAAGVKKSAHGVRKIAATTAANNGATVAELEAIFGWHGGGMASLYTRDADRVRLARQAIEKLNAGRTAPPAPRKKVRAGSPKS